MYLRNVKRAVPVERPGNLGRRLDVIGSLSVDTVHWDTGRRGRTGFVVRAAVWLMRWLDSVNLLPSALTRNDPLYASLFVANLGSIGLADSYASMRLEIGSAYTLVFFVMIIPLLIGIQWAGRK